MHDLIIIGGGPAGITAGIYAARKKLNTLLITKKWGEQIQASSEVENWPGEKHITGADLIRKMVDHLKVFDIDIKENTEVIDLEKQDENFQIRDNKDNEYQSRAVIISTGKVPRELNVPGEDEFKGRGVSFCSTCDAPMFKNKDVAVIGGGNVGFEMALDLTKYASKVYILEFLEKTQGDQLLKEKLENIDKVEIITNSAVKKFKGDKFLNSLTYENRDTGEDKEVEVKGAFIAIGTTPKAGFAEGLVEYDDLGEIKTKRNTSTKTPGLFAAGDIIDTKYEQLIIAAGEGCKAALSAYDYLNKQIKS